MPAGVAELGTARACFDCVGNPEWSRLVVCQLCYVHDQENHGEDQGIEDGSRSLGCGIVERDRYWSCAGQDEAEG